MNISRGKECTEKGSQGRERPDSFADLTCVAGENHLDMNMKLPINLTYVGVTTGACP